MSRLTEIADEKAREAEEYVDETWIQRQLFSDAALLRAADAVLQAAVQYSAGPEVKHAVAAYQQAEAAARGSAHS